MKIAIWTLMLALGAGACSSSMMSEADMRSMIADVRAENDEHQAAAAAATTLDGMHAESARHGGVMSEMMSDMSAMMNEMSSHCTGAGMEAMHGMHGDMTGEMSRHATAMDGAAELAGAKAEVGRHGQTMAGMLDDMDGASGDMGCM